MYFIAPVAVAYAQGPANGGAGGLISMAPLILLFVVFYFLLIRPQQKKAKEHKEMVAKLAKGDNIVIGGGIHGRITDTGDSVLTVEIAQNVRVKVNRDAVVAKKQQ